MSHVARTDHGSNTSANRFRPVAYYRGGGGAGQKVGHRSPSRWRAVCRIPRRPRRDNVIGIRSKVVIAGVAALTLAGCGSSGNSAAGSPSAAAGTPSANAADSPSADPAGSPSAEGAPSGPPDPAIAVCQGFRAIEHYMVSQLVAEVTSGTPPTSVNWKLMRDGSKMAHWAYVVTQAVMNGTTNATGASF